jgi:hypothetical protein
VRRPHRAALKNPVELTARWRDGIRKAHQLINTLKKGDREAIAEATMLQGVLSGDVMAAAVVTRQRLQRENLRLRERLTRARIKTEEAKYQLLNIESEVRSRPQLDPYEILTRVRAIYGLLPVARAALLPPAETTAIEILQEQPTSPEQL